MGRIGKKKAEKQPIREIYENKAVEWAKNYADKRMLVMPGKWSEQQHEQAQRKYLEALLSPESNAYDMFCEMISRKIDNL